MKKRILWSLALVTILSTFSMIFVAYASNDKDNRRLGVEINVKNKPFYFPAAVGNRIITGLVRVRSSETPSANEITGLQVAPTMVNGKVRVEVTAVYGDIRAVKSCKGLNAFKQTLLGSKTLNKGESLNLSELANLKLSENEAPLVVEIVGMKKSYNDNPYQKSSGAAQLPGCGNCGDVVCCPYPGKCIGCGDCGLICDTKKPKEPGHEVPQDKNLGE